MLSSNLQFLRRKTGYSQQELADMLEIPRTTWSGYELGKVEPNINMLQKISIFFHQSIDRLLNQRIDFDELEIARADTLRVLAITMDQDQRQNIELVYSKAEAGYLDGFQDPEFISELPKMYIPNLPTGSYRAFEIHGDSMLPMPSGSLVISKYVESLKDLKDDKTYIIVTEKDFNDDLSGGDLDVPGSELDDEEEKIGSEDEENNSYSIGGDMHNDLEENQGD